jgi:hypothetical protein
MKTKIRTNFKHGTYYVVIGEWRPINKKTTGFYRYFKISETMYIAIWRALCKLK